MLSWTQDIAITLARDANLRELVDLRIFNGLQPGTTIEQATKQIGPPARAWSETRQWEIGTDGTIVLWLFNKEIRALLAR